MRAVDTIRPLSPIQSECPNCAFLEWGWPANLTAGESRNVYDLVTHQQPIAQGNFLYQAGLPLASLHVISSGFLKTSLGDQEGRNQVTGFCMTGELVGMDAIGIGKHISDTVALEASRVCGMRYADLTDLGRRIPAMQHHFHRVLGAELARDQGIMLLLGVMNAQERVAMFLLNLSARFAAHGYSASRFRLPMTRAEIGSYLGLKLETVSRALSHLHDQKMILINGKDVELKSVPDLRRMIGQHGSPNAHSLLAVTPAL